MVVFPEPGPGVRRRLSRRKVLSALLAGSSTLATRSLANAQQNQPDRPALSLRPLLDELAVTNGVYRGAYRATPNGPVNWYFANLGMKFLVEEDPDSVLRYMDAYVRSLDTTRNDIADVSPDLSTPLTPDSNDAYAGTFLSLAVRYIRTTGDVAWWNLNLDRLKAVAYSNLTAQVKSNGLVRAFQRPAKNDIGYLMDQCEAYAGLRDFGQYLRETGDRDAAYFSAFAMNLGIAIHALFDARANRWRWCDVSAPYANAWYPDLTAQIYPHLCDVHSTDAPGDYYRLQRGYEVLNHAAPNWMKKPQDIYPWLVVGYYAALRQADTNNAMAMTSMALSYYLPGQVNTGRMLISEIGYVKGIVELAARVPPSSGCLRN